MRTLSIMAFASFLLLWGVYTFLKDDTIYPQKVVVEPLKKSPLPPTKHEEGDTLLTQNKRRQLDKIGTVINEDNAEIDRETREQIKVAKKAYDYKQDLKNKQSILEQSFMDKASSLKDIKRLQGEIKDLKSKMNLDVTNTEKWDPKFVYYLMIQENYTYSEVNAIKSLSENGLNSEELNYINDLIKGDAFKDRIQAFKNQGDTGRAVASLKKKPKEKDDFIDDPAGADSVSMESKIIEMNYNQEEKEEMIYGSN